MTHRITRAVEWASPCERPRGCSGRPSNPAAAAGMRFERRVGKALTASGQVWQLGPWFEFSDANGHGYCQPDALHDLGSALLVLECKLNWTPLGHTQISELYAPVLAALHKKHTLGVQVVKALTPDCPPSTVSYDLPSAMRKALEGPSVLLWLGTDKTLLTLGTSCG